MPLKTWIAAASLSLAAAAAFAQSDVAHREKPAFPRIELPERARGERAVQLLGARLAEVAAYYGMTPGEFARILREDRRALVDRTGRFLFEDELDTPLESPGVGTPDSLTLTGALAPLDQTFLLHSRPGAKRTIYLDFNGATLTGTAWNTAQQPTIFAEPFDTDGVPGTFSTAELRAHPVHLATRRRGLRAVRRRRHDRSAAGRSPDARRARATTSTAPRC